MCLLAQMPPLGVMGQKESNVQFGRPCTQSAAGRAQHPGTGEKLGPT